MNQARQEGYRSRAAYKLLQIVETDKLLRAGMTVVELGSAPGAWTQVLSRQILRKDTGRVIALDLLEMDPVPGVEFIQGDFRELAVLEQLEQALNNTPVDLIVSDMSPNMSGVAASDMARMADLTELSLEFARDNLASNGALLVKSFHGSGFSQQVKEFKQTFVTVKERKPAASRAESAETYLLGIHLKPPKVDPAS